MPSAAAIFAHFDFFAEGHHACAHKGRSDNLSTTHAFSPYGYVISHDAGFTTLRP
jgi:hypothetical protein